MGFMDIFRRRPATVETRSRGAPVMVVGGSLYGSLNDNNPTVIFCENLIANVVSNLPLALYFRGDKSRFRAYKHPAYRVVKSEPNRNEPPTVFYSTLVKHLIRKGNAYVFKVRDNAGSISQLILLNPDRVTVKMTGYQKTFSVNGEIYTTEDIIHIPSMYGYDGVKGKSILDYARGLLDSSGKMDQYLAEYFDNTINTKIKVSLNETDIDIDDKDQVQEVMDFYSHMGSKTNSGKPIVEYGKIKVEPINLPSNGDAELTKNREFNERAICELFNVPYAILKNQNAYGSFEQFNLFFLRTCISQYTSRIEEYFSYGLLSAYERERYYFEYSYEEMLRPDTNTRTEIYHRMMSDGILCINEIRERENLDALEDEVAGTTHFLNGQPLREDVIEAWGAGAKLKAMQLEKLANDPAANQDNKSK